MSGVRDIIEMHLQKAMTATNLYWTAIIAGVSLFFPIISFIKENPFFITLPAIIIVPVFLVYVALSMRSKYAEHYWLHIQFVSVAYCEEHIWRSVKYCPREEVEVRRAAAKIHKKLLLDEFVVCESLLSYYALGPYVPAK